MQNEREGKRKGGGEEREGEEKDNFHEELQQAIDECNRNDIVVVMGDFKAKVGRDNEGYDSCIGFCCGKWPGHHGNIVSTQRHSQDNMVLGKRESEESDGPSFDQWAVEICIPRH